MMPGVLSGKRVIVYGVGAMGAIVTRLLVERGVEIVGAIGTTTLYESSNIMIR